MDLYLQFSLQNIVEKSLKPNEYGLIYRLIDFLVIYFTVFVEKSTNKGLKKWSLNWSFDCIFFEIVKMTLRGSIAYVT